MTKLSLMQKKESPCDFQQFGQLKLQDAVSRQNLSALFRREKKAAVDMSIVIAVLMLCLAPAIAADNFRKLFGHQYEYFHFWLTTLIFIKSSIISVIYLARNSKIRNAGKRHYVLLITC